MRIWKPYLKECEKTLRIEVWKWAIRIRSKYFIIEIG